MLQYPEGVDFDGEKAQLVFGIAGIGDEHLGLLAKISEIIEDPERLEQLKTTKNVDEIMEMFKQDLSRQGQFNKREIILAY